MTVSVCTVGSRVVDHAAHLVDEALREEDREQSVREVADGGLVHGHLPLLLTWSLVDAHGDVGHTVVRYGGAMVDEARAEGDLVTCLDEPRALEVEALSLATIVLHAVWVLFCSQKINFNKNKLNSKLLVC
jgi:hypothetical protein